MVGSLVGTLFGERSLPGGHRLGVVEGEGVGPEVIGAATTVLAAAAQAHHCDVEVLAAPAIEWMDASGQSLSDPARAFYRSLFEAGVPLLHGPAGGRQVYALRSEFDLFAKLVPLQPQHALDDASILRPERLSAVDVMIVRDNVGGLYQGSYGWRDGGRVAYQEASYTRDDVARLLEVAVRAARQRRGRLAVVVKPGGIPTVSSLWRECAERLVPEDVTCEYVEVDNACFQIVADPGRFDVVATPNMFGDVVGDTAALLLGSRGMSYSANFGTSGRAVYQTAHGAAHDIAGRGIANPVGQILSLAWLLRDSLGLGALAASIDAAVSSVLADGLRTPDIAGPTSRVVGTDELAAAIAERVRSEAPEHAHR